ncbi:MAG: two-component regulator propeller domain-containing protein [Verrucomicrobiia bacterium]
MKKVSTRRLISRASSIALGLPLWTGVQAQPVITYSPADHVSAIGGEVLFQVAATGSEPLTYQWRLNGSALEGATQAFLKITNVQPSHAGSYAVSVTDAGGSTNSQPATLIVDPEWVLYNRRNCALPYNGVVDLEVDRDGNVWVATGRWNAFGGGGLAKFNGREWTVYQSGKSPLPSNDCTGLTQDADGNLWVATESGVARFDRFAGWKVVTRSQVWFPMLDLDGQLWVGSSSGVMVYDGAKWKRYQRANSGLPSDFVGFITVDDKGRKWISTVGGLAVLDEENWTTYNRANSGLPSDTVGPIAFDDEGIAWIGTSGGLARFDGEQWTVYSRSNSGLPISNIGWELAIDAKGVKWIATEGGGLTRFDGTNWTTWNRANSRLPDNNVQAIAFDRYENLWLGLKDGGVAAYREGGVIPHLQIESLRADGEGHLVLRWTGGKGPYQAQKLYATGCAGMGGPGRTDRQAEPDP